MNSIRNFSNYWTVFNPNTGFFARIEKPGFPEPFWAETGPELIDISITNWCDFGCSHCYRSSSVTGKHMGLEAYTVLIREAAGLGVMQVALGGGNPNQHPDFIEILRITRETGIVPNYTTNGRGMTGEILQATKEYCGALAVSAYPPYNSLPEILGRTQNFGIKTNIHFLLSSSTIVQAVQWIKHPPSWLEGINAIIFLTYKPVGRKVEPDLLLSRSDRMNEFFSLVQNGSPFFKLGFDSCAVSGLLSYTSLDAKFFDSCEGARFSMFVSEDLKAYPCSFMVERTEGVPLDGTNLLEVWKHSHLFEGFRDRLRKPQCSHCKSLSVCKGGCPVFPEINMCVEPAHRQARNADSI